MTDAELDRQVLETLKKLQRASAEVTALSTKLSAVTSSFRPMFGVNTAAGPAVFCCETSA